MAIWNAVCILFFVEMATLLEVRKFGSFGEHWSRWREVSQVLWLRRSRVVRLLLADALFAAVVSGLVQLGYLPFADASPRGQPHYFGAIGPALGLAMGAAGYFGSAEPFHKVRSGVDRFFPWRSNFVVELKVRILSMTRKRVGPRKDQLNFQLESLIKSDLLVASHLFRFTVEFFRARQESPESSLAETLKEWNDANGQMDVVSRARLIRRLGAQLLINGFELPVVLTLELKTL